jgi:glycosyltransferase involved in cell wall biosynthesis
MTQSTIKTNRSLQSRPDATRSLRIAFAMINCNQRDGSARAVNEVAERLADRGHEVHLYARKAEDLNLKKVQWHRVPGPGWPEVADFWSYHHFVNVRLQCHSTPNAQRSVSCYDIIHSIGCNTLQANVVTIQNVQPAKIEILARLAAAERVIAARRLTRWLYLRATCAAERRLYQARAGRRPPMFLPVSRGTERELRRHYQIGDALVRVIPNAADTDRFRPLEADEKRRWRESEGMKCDEKVLIFVGGEWARKGLDLAIRALALIADIKVKLFVAGDDPDRDRFVRLGRELGVGERVIFGGFRRDVAAALGAADAFLFPSWYEAFSLATIEAAACGLPIFATHINGAEDFIQPGVNGEFIAHEPEQIASVMRAALADASSLPTMGTKARALVEQSYTWDRVATMTEAAYRDYREE